MRVIYAVGAVLWCVVAFVRGESPEELEDPCHKDRVRRLPGYPKTLSSNMYAGYISAGKKSGTNISVHYHYILFESENDPTNDPLLVWTNGGPGAASIYGALYELGPYLLNYKSLLTKEYNKSKIPTLFKNDYAWNRNANLLIMTGTAPVGYAYCESPGPNATDCGQWNDTTTAEGNLAFLEGFYNKFKRFRTNQNKLYLSGESYAGVYVPQLAELIMNSTSDLKNYLSGTAVGNGCHGKSISCGRRADNPNYFLAKVEFYYGHGQVSRELYQGINDNNCKYVPVGKDTTPECKKVVRDIMDHVTLGRWEYGLYSECHWGSNTTLPGYSSYPCPGGAGKTWVENEHVRKALHVKTGVPFQVGVPYVNTFEDVTPVYKRFMSNPKLKTLVYVGDTDTTLNLNLQQWWISTLGLTIKNNNTTLNRFRPWTLDGKKEEVGYASYYEQNFSFVTIRGATHLAPQSKPRQAALMIESFMNNKELPRYKPT